MSDRYSSMIALLVVMLALSSCSHSICEMAKNGRAEKIREFGQHSTVNSACDKIGRTPLHYAANECDVKAIEALIAVGADPSIPDRGGCTAMISATLIDCPSAITALTALLSSPDEGCIDTSPLFVVHNPQTARLLVNLGADVNYMTSSGLTPLAIAVNVQNRDLVEVLLELDANPFVSGIGGKDLSDWPDEEITFLIKESRNRMTDKVGE